MRRKNTVEKIGEHVISRGGDGRALSLGDNGGTPLEPLFTVNEAAAILRCSSHSLNRWRLTGGGPKFIYVGTMYKIAEEAKPITGRGVGYKLFAAGLISGIALPPRRSHPIHRPLDTEFHI
jgi:hypothetical protein